MHALIMSFGTRGDIQPYAALARGLARAGHDVTLAVPDAFADLVPGAITLHPAGSEMLRLVQDVMPELSGPRDALRTLGIMKSAMREHIAETWDAARAARPDVVVYHPKCLAGPHIAEALAVPGVLSIPLPFYTPTGAYPVPFLGGASFGVWGNRATYRFNRMATVMYGGMINDFRQRAGLTTKTGRFADPLRNPDGSPVHTLYPYSRHVVPIPADYPPSAHVTGYFFLDDDGAWEPPARLTDFLAAGDPPVYVGFGSMGFGKGADQRRDAILGALAATGLRGIVATGWGGIEPGDAPSDDVLVIEGAPHDWLFPRTAAVVHHGGAGSTAAGLRAGKPSLIVPFLGDQPFWGAQVHRIGAGPEPLSRRKLASGLAGSLTELVGDAGYARRAAALGEAIRGEDGVGEGVRVLEEIAG
ncbi:glycosyltransferase [Myceligenerans halotolerans]